MATVVLPGIWSNISIFLQGACALLQILFMGLICIKPRFWSCFKLFITCYGCTHWPLCGDGVNYTIKDIACRSFYVHIGIVMAVAGTMGLCQLDKNGKESQAVSNWITKANCY